MRNLSVRVPLPPQHGGCAQPSEVGIAKRLHTKVKHFPFCDLGELTLSTMKLWPNPYCVSSSLNSFPPPQHLCLRRSALVAIGSCPRPLWFLKGGRSFPETAGQWGFREVTLKPEKWRIHQGLFTHPLVSFHEHNVAAQRINDVGWFCWFHVNNKKKNRISPHLDIMKRTL